MLSIVAPTIKMTRSDASELLSLAMANLHKSPDITGFLIGEVARATLVEPDEARQVVTMNSCVEFYYSLTSQIRKVQLVYPTEADIEHGKISVMTPIGAALIGLSKGQSIEWRTVTGMERSLIVLEIDEDKSCHLIGQ